MPILAKFKWLYPIDWKQLTDFIRFERADGRCENCGRPHGRMVFHLGDGRWWDEDNNIWRNGQGRALKRPASLQEVADTLLPLMTKVVLATAHLDHDPTNSRPKNLKAFCQRCHMLHDRPEHQRRRLLTLRMRKAVGDLFLGPYS